MNKSWPTVRRLAIGIAVASVVAGCTSSPWTPPVDVARRIATATTPSDHEELVSYYRGEAAKAKVLANDHRRMAQAYRQRPRVDPRGSSLDEHCESIVRAQESMAAEYERLAASHGEMAQAMRR